MKVDFNQIKTTISLPDFLLELGWKIFQLLSQNEQRNAYHRHQAELTEPIYLLGRA
jgi:hypothetical protein